MIRRILKRYPRLHERLWRIKYGSYVAVNTIKQSYVEWRDKRQLIKKLVRRRHKTIIYPYTVSWDIALTQRPHHFAYTFAKFGFQFIYFDHKQDIINDNLIILPVDEMFDTLLKKMKGAWILVSSTNPYITIEELKAFKENGLKIIYDYIDEVDDQIVGMNLDLQIKRHKFVLTSGIADLVLSVSRKLHEEVSQFYSKDKALLVENAVDYNHFHIAKDPNNVPKRIAHIVGQGKPIIGYYGALAPWIDIDLINYLAERKPEWNILLIGPDYDGNTTHKIKKLPNIHWIGHVNYQHLPQYAVWFDVAIIPFKEGEIARATSPIKLYEYMALNKPVVYTKDLDECKRYTSPLLGENKEDFINKIEYALTLKDNPDFISLVDKEARENTWEARVKSIIEAMA